MSVLLDPSAYRGALIAYLVLTVATAIALSFVSAPYGRHERPGWGPTLPARVAWILMEAPASLAFLGFYLLGEQRGALVPLVLLGLWQIHYAQRAFVFPFLMRMKASRAPLLIPALAIAYNLLNAYTNALWVSHFGRYDAGWLTDPRFLVGVALFVGGYAVNRWADQVLARLRAPGEVGYKIPHGGLYRWISCPNYLGEIVEWFGWALLTWSPAGLCFALYTTANLAPRAFVNHRWYQRRFPDYPPERKALVPYLL